MFFYCLELPDGTYVGADVINRYFNGNATKADVDTIKQLGSSINEENMNSVLKRMDDIANVKMGKQTYGEMNKAMKGMTASQKIDHMAQVMSSPEFKAHTEELIKTAQEQKAKAEGKRSVEGESTDSATKENIKQEAVNSDNEVKADKGTEADNAVNKNAVISNEGNINNNINSSDNSIQDKTASVNKNVTMDKVNDSNTDIKDNVDETLLNEDSKGIDTDNGLTENDTINSNVIEHEKQNNVINSEKDIQYDKEIANEANKLYNIGNETENVKAYLRDKPIRDKIKSDSVNKNLNIGSFNKHIEGTNEYNQYVMNLKNIGEYGPSRLTITQDEANDLIKKYCETGVLSIDINGKWRKIETITIHDKNIGIAIDNRTGKEAETMVFKIHYSKDGIHLVPDYPSKKGRKGTK